MALPRLFLSFCLLLACLFPVWAEAPKSQTVEAEGEAVIGSSQTQAKEDALAQASRLAVEQVLGVYVVSETLVENAVVVKDTILTQASGYVSGYEILSAGVSEGVYKVRIRATVSIEPLVEQLGKLGLLREWTVAVVLASDTPQTSTESARIALNQVILEKGFKVADENALIQLNQPALMAQIQAGNYLAALPILRNQGVDVLIAGKTFTQPSATGPMESYGGIQTILTEGRIDARVIRVDTGELIAAQSFNGVAGGSTQAIAESKAIAQAAKNSGQYFAKEIARLPAATSQKVLLVVSGLSFAREKAFREALAQIPGLRSVKRQVYQNQQAQYELDFGGKADQLADRLAEASQLKAFKFDIIGVSSGRIDAKGQ